jgi:VWFA-related protein
MRLRTLSVSSCALAAVALLVTPGLQADQAQERTVVVTVLDKEDAPIRDLTAADFTVYENRAARKVTAATLSTEPLSVLVMIDTAKSPIGTSEPTRDVRTALRTFVKTVYAGGTPVRMALMEYAGAGVMLRNFTELEAELDKAAARVVPSQRQNVVLLEALIEGARELRKQLGPRRAIVVLDRGSHDNSRVMPERIVDEVSKAGASVWAVSVASSRDTGQERQLEGTRSVSSSQAREAALDSLTEATGGARLTAMSSTGLESMMKKVADALISQYEVTYASTGPSMSVVPMARRGEKFLRAPWIR